MGFRLPDRLAGACFDRLVVDPADGAGPLVDAVATGVLSGSAAKLGAMEAGEVPPGADPVAVAERWLADPGLSWSCWAVSTLTVALARGCGWRADVVATRRIDPQAKPVDFHALVVLDDGKGPRVCDPYFGVGVIDAERGGDHLRPGVWAECRPAPGGWSVAVGTVQWPAICRYRTLTGPLQPDDVEAFCRASTTHTGVGPTRYALRLLGDGVAMARAADGCATLRRWRLGPAQVGGATPEEAHHPTYGEAVRALLAV